MQERFSFLAQQFRRFSQPVAILDLEATGGDLCRDRITEIAYLRFDGDEVKAVQHLVNPETPISDFIANLTGISNEMVENAPIFADLLPEILPDLRGCILLAHNSQFDYTLLVNECQRAGVDFATSALCTVKLSKRLYPHEYKHSLDAICARFHLQNDGARHRAMTDVLLLADFLQQSAQAFQAVWIQAALDLISVRIPSGLPERLVNDLHHLGDGWGVAHYLDASGGVLGRRAYERGFMGAVNDLRAGRFSGAQGIRWQPAIGALDALNMCVEQAQWGEYVWAEEGANRFTVCFAERDGCLKAEIMLLTQGVFDAPPYGVFLHPKAAKKALQSWAEKEGICLTMLGFNPHKLPENAPCAAAQIHACNAACQTNNVALHNQMVRQALPRFLLGDWHWRSAISITETHPITAQRKTFVCERGALRLANGRWYWGRDLLDCIKRKVKENRHEIRVQAA